MLPLRTPGDHNTEVAGRSGYLWATKGFSRRTFPLHAVLSPQSPRFRRLRFPPEQSERPLEHGGGRCRICERKSGALLVGIGPFPTADGQGLLLEMTYYDGTHADLPDLRGDSSDIYFAQRTGPGTWSAPVNLGDTINFAGSYETDPFLTADGSTLYFSRATAPNGGPTNTTWDPSRRQRVPSRPSP